MTLLLVYVLVALIVSFTCSILEAVLLSITPAYVAAREQSGAADAARLRDVKENIDRPLAAILGLNTMAHTIGAAGAGAQAARVFGDGSIGVFSAVLTLVILVGTEIVPKTLGAVHWKRLAPAVVSAARALVVVLWPIVRLARWLTELLTPKHGELTVSREEITALAAEGAKTGVVAAGESRVVANLFRLAALRACDIMTAHEHVVALPETMTVGEALRCCPQLQFSRIPVYAGPTEDRRYTGYTLKDDILSYAAQDRDRVPLSSICRELITVPHSLPLPAVFDSMVDRREHIAFVADDAGNCVGIVTMEDVIETLLGLEIYDEVDDEKRMQELARAHWRERARRLGRISDVSGGTASLGITAPQVRQPTGTDQ